MFYIRRDAKSSARRPGGFAIRRKKRFDLLNRGICNPPVKENAFSFAADFKSAEPKWVRTFFNAGFQIRRDA